ncbi:MAG: LysE family translocator [Neisseriales bacterium]|jgi:threonine/homoserine/homoserine lactone efflux protein|nr:MAG: LysE family translocator [Neisseriales bacterium]
MLIDISLIIKTLVILFLAVMSPGPDFVMVLRNSLSYGRRAGLFSALGIATGCLFSFTIVVCGLQVLFSYHLFKAAFSLVCGSYLIYLGFMSIRNKSQQQHIEEQYKQSAPMSTYFRAGLLTNLLNPKLYTMAAAILTYTEQQHPSIATNIIIIIGQAVVALLWFVCVSIVFSHSKIQDAYLKRERIINILVGFIFIIIGSKIMFG